MSVLAKKIGKAFEVAAFGHAPGRAVGRAFVKHHNKIQLAGYEFANAYLAYSSVSSDSGGGFEVDYETGAAASFFVGSTVIAGFDFSKRPTLLFYGGLGLTAGGAFLGLAGYPTSGIPVMIASLETARGGLHVMNEHRSAVEEDGGSVQGFTHWTQKIGGALMKPYTASVEYACGKCTKLGEFANTRPFVTGTLIKLPGRVAFIGQKAMQGDWGGVAVGVSWLLGGDGGLTFNDEKFKASVAERSGVKPEEPSFKSL